MIKSINVAEIFIKFSKELGLLSAKQDAWRNIKQDLAQDTYMEFPFESSIQNSQTEYPHRVPKQSTHTEYPHRISIESTHTEYPYRVPTQSTHTEYTSIVPIQSNHTEFQQRIIQMIQKMVKVADLF